MFYLLCLITGQCPIGSKEEGKQVISLRLRKYVRVEESPEEARPKEANSKEETPKVELTAFVIFGAVSTLVLTFIVALMNISSLVYALYIIIWCPYKNCGYISVPVTQEAMNISPPGVGVIQPAPLMVFDDWQKVVITTASLSGAVSYLYMVFVLHSLYNGFKDCICGALNGKINAMWGKCGEQLQERDKETHAGLLKSPFLDDNTTYHGRATKLSPKQATYFMTIFLLNIFVFFGNVAVFFVIFDRSVDKKLKTREIWDAAGLASQFVSQVCAIFSCFIFSKLAYSVGSTCVHRLPEWFKKVDRATQLQQNGNTHTDVNHKDITSLEDVHKCISPGDKSNCNGSSLYILKAIAKWYSRLVKTSLNPFSGWFAVHWILYTVSAFMSLSYLAQTIILELYGKEEADKACHAEKYMMCRLKLAYIFLFAINHCILFLYPCFRAASVTMAYSTMIRKVAQAEWTNISLDDKEKFINYLKLQDSTFKIKILCAKMPFGFYVAYFSIILGLFGAVLKLAL